MSQNIVLVTGGSGLVGHGIKHVATKQNRMENAQWIYVRSTDCNLTDLEATRKLFDLHKPTQVIHLAARVGGLFANMNDNIGFYEDNLNMNNNVVKVCHEHKIQKAIFCLSTCIFPAECKLPMTEDDIHMGPPHFSNEGYAHAKRMLEVMVRFYRQAYGYRWTCIIPTNIYGPYDNFNLEGAHVIPALIHKCWIAKRDNTPFVVSGSGTPLRQFITNYDLARIILNLLDIAESSQELPTSVLGVGDEEHSIMQVAEYIKTGCQFEGEMKLDTTKADGIFRKTASNALLRKLMPDFVFTPMSEGIVEAVEWFKDNYTQARV